MRVPSGISYLDRLTAGESCLRPFAYLRVNVLQEREVPRDGYILGGTIRSGEV